MQEKELSQNNETAPDLFAVLRAANGRPHIFR
jgi:hypothetical protein